MPELNMSLQSFDLPEALTAMPAHVLELPGVLVGDVVLEGSPPDGPVVALGALIGPLVSVGPLMSPQMDHLHIYKIIIR